MTQQSNETEGPTDASQLLWREIQQDRKQQRRAAFFKYGLLAAVGLIYAGALLWGSGKWDPESSQPYAALVRIQGDIVPGREASAAVVNPLLEKAFADKNAKGVVIVLNSPGGTPVQSALIHDRIQALKQSTQKPVIVVGEDIVASGAYLIAVAADKIVVNRSTVVGSIGVVSRSFGFTGLMDKLGVERRVMTAGDSKNLGDPFGPETEAGRAKQAELLEEIHEHFKDAVKDGRQGRLVLDTPGLFSGTVWTGQQAVSFGLVDELGDLRSVGREHLKVSRYKAYSPQKSVIDLLMGGVATHLGTWLTSTSQPELTVQ